MTNIVINGKVECWEDLDIQAAKDYAALVDELITCEEKELEISYQKEEIRLHMERAIKRTTDKYRS